MGLKDHVTQFKGVKLSEGHNHTSVNDTWVKFKTCFVEAVETFIPSKMIKTKYSVPWIYVMIKRLLKKRIELYLCAREYKDNGVKIHYKRLRAHVQKVFCLLSVSNIFTLTIKSLKRLKSFGHLSNLLKKTGMGSHHSEKTELLKQMQLEGPLFVIDNFNQSSRAKATLNRPPNGLVRSSPWGT